MKTSLEHLPEQKQQELQRAIEIIREEIDLDCGKKTVST